MGASSQLTSSPSYWLKSLFRLLEHHELSEEVPRRHAEGNRKVSGSGPGEQGDDVLLNQLLLLWHRQGNLSIHGHPVQVSGGEQAGGGWGDDEKHIEVRHRGENRASHLYLWGAGEGREQWVNRAGNIWPTLEHAGTVLQGRRNMWVMATSAMTSSSQDCLITIIIIIIGGDFFFPRLSRHHHLHHRHRRWSLLPKIVSEVQSFVVLC